MKRFTSHLLILSLLFLTMSSGCAMKKAYTLASSMDTVESHEDFIGAYPDGKYTPLSEIRLDELKEEQAWNKAKLMDMIYYYESFISTYPQSVKVKEAENRIAFLRVENAWKEALDKNSIDGYEDYLSTHPNTIHADFAEKRIAELRIESEWQNALKEESTFHLKELLDRYPDSKFERAARERIKELDVIRPAFDKALSKNEIAAYLDFISKYPTSEYAGEARARITMLEEELWSKAMAANTIKAYKDYMRELPYGAYYTEAEKRIIDLEVDEIFKGDHGELPPMSQSGTNALWLKTANISIDNNTEYTLTVRYSGEQSRRIVLEPHGLKELVLPNGSYRITASVNAANVTNYAGEEVLTGGDYSSEYYIVTSR